MLVFYTNEPVLDISIEQGADFGLHRDRNPDTDWTELRHTKMNNKVQDVSATPELLQILLEDLAYAYGSDTVKFANKLKEFKLIIIEKKEVSQRKEINEQEVFIVMQNNSVSRETAIELINS